MNNSASKIRATISNLARVIEKERQAILDRAYDKIDELSKDKADLLDEFNELLSNIDDGGALANLSKALKSLRLQAEDNAENLKKLAAGVKKAQQTLRNLSERDLGAGAYRRDGAMIKNSRATVLSAKM